MRKKRKQLREVFDQRLNQLHFDFKLETGLVENEQMSVCDSTRPQSRSAQGNCTSDSEQEFGKKVRMGTRLGGKTEMKNSPKTSKKRQGDWEKFTIIFEEEFTNEMM